jgi:two-component system sensor histidine kinase RegB
MIYATGVWVALMCSIAFMGAYAYRVAEEARQLSDALSASELVLAREQHLHALDGLAAAAAHELGTPLATVYLTAKELMRDMERARRIRSGSGGNPARRSGPDPVAGRAMSRHSLQALVFVGRPRPAFSRRTAVASCIEEVVAPCRGLRHRHCGRHSGRGRRTHRNAQSGDPLRTRQSSWRMPSTSPGSKVTITGRFDARRLTIEIADDGSWASPPM